MPRYRRPACCAGATTPPPPSSACAPTSRPRSSNCSSSMFAPPTCGEIEQQILDYVERLRRSGAPIDQRHSRARARRLLVRRVARHARTAARAAADRGDAGLVRSRRTSPSACSRRSPISRAAGGGIGARAQETPQRCADGDHRAAGTAGRSRSSRQRQATVSRAAAPADGQPGGDPWRSGGDHARRSLPPECQTPAVTRVPWVAAGTLRLLRSSCMVPEPVQCGGDRKQPRQLAVGPAPPFYLCPARRAAPSSDLRSRSHSAGGSRQMPKTTAESLQPGGVSRRGGSQFDELSFLK